MVQVTLLCIWTCWRHKVKHGQFFAEMCITAVPLSSSEMNLHSACAEWDSRENWGKEKATVRLQAFLELAVGEERLKAAQDIVKAKVTYK